MSTPSPRRASASSTAPPRHKDGPRTRSSPASAASSAHSCATCSSHCVTAATPHQPTKRVPDRVSELLGGFSATQVPLLVRGRRRPAEYRGGERNAREAGLAL